MASAVVVTVVVAHEGHKPIPSAGASVEGDVLKLSEPAQRAAGVQTIEIAAQPFEPTITAPVTVHMAWDAQAFASSPVDGTVDRVLVRAGDRVENGQTLARVRSQDVSQFLAERKQAAERLAAARTALDGFAPPAANAPDADAERIRLETDIADAQAVVDGLDERLRLICGPAGDANGGDAEAFALVRAPLAGVVTRVDTAAGSGVQALLDLVEVVDRSRVWAEARLVEAHVTDVRVGAAARVTFAGGIEVDGSVEWIAPVLDPVTQTLHAVVSVRDPRARLVDGLSGVAEIVIERSEQALLVPASAIVHLGLDAIAFVEVSPGAYRRTPVIVGRGRGAGDRIDVREGLRIGDRVVVQGAHEFERLFPNVIPHLEGDVLRRADVAIAPVTVQPIDDVVRVPGRLALAVERLSLVASRTPARLESVTVKPGDHVEAGQTVATVIPQGTFAAIADCRLAARRVDLDRSALDRMTQLAKKAGFDAKHLETARSNLEAADAALTRARRRLMGLGMGDADIDRAIRDVAAPVAIPLRTPIAGEVLHVDVERGRFVLPEDHIVEVADLSLLRLALEAPEAWATQIAPGSSLRVEFPAHPGMRLDARVRTTLPRVRGNARTLTTLADVPNPDRRFPSGTAATATLVLRAGASAVVVPREAVLADGLRRFVIRVEEGEAYRTEVEVGRSDDRFVEIVRGVYPGDSVVGGGAERVRAALSASR
ncbi:MAG: efflux RND transporter periplasmic adaptor subunit [Planctomycetes bacterium]|nr:efflux RND transporter periplasmic adaptor subunit [Planctomycetota bacterium]